MLFEISTFFNYVIFPVFLFIISLCIIDLIGRSEETIIFRNYNEWKFGFYGNVVILLASPILIVFIFWLLRILNVDFWLSFLLLELLWLLLVIRSLTNKKGFKAEEIIEIIGNKPVKFLNLKMMPTLEEIDLYTESFEFPSTVPQKIFHIISKNFNSLKSKDQVEYIQSILTGKKNIITTENGIWTPLPEFQSISNKFPVKFTLLYLSNEFCLLINSSTRLRDKVKEDFENGNKFSIICLNTLSHSLNRYEESIIDLKKFVNHPFSSKIDPSKFKSRRGREEFLNLFANITKIKSGMRLFEFIIFDLKNSGTLSKAEIKNLDDKFSKTKKQLEKIECEMRDQLQTINLFVTTETEQTSFVVNLLISFVILIFTSIILALTIFDGSQPLLQFLDKSVNEISKLPPEDLIGMIFWLFLGFMFIITVIT